ncbi:MAG: HAD-IIA family hydrolase [Halobacteriales archaeon]
MTIAGAIIDLDGTVYRGESLLPGADRGIQALRAAGIETLFVSNNPTEPPETYAESLAGMGIDVDPKSILTSGVVTREYLERQHAGESVYVVGEDGLREQLSGRRLVEDPIGADVVVASVDREFTYDRLAEAARAFVAGDPAFVGTDPDRLIPADDDRLLPGSGAIVGAIAATVDRDPDPMLGKPSRETARAVLDRIDADSAACLVIGDRLDTDVALGERIGARTALVRTGIHGEADIEDYEATPDHVIDSLGEVGTLLDGE